MLASGSAGADAEPTFSAQEWSRTDQNVCMFQKLATISDELYVPLGQKVTSRPSFGGTSGSFRSMTLPLLRTTYTRGGEFKNASKVTMERQTEKAILRALSMQEQMLIIGSKMRKTNA